MPGKQWDDEDSSSTSGSEASSAAPPPPTLLRRDKFEDEEENDSDVLDSWDADDSEVEREKAKKEAEAKAKAAAAAAAKKKPKVQRIADHMADRVRQQEAADAAAARIAGETEAQRRDRLRRTEQEADLSHAADLFGDAGLSAGTGTRKSAAALKASAVVLDESNPESTVLDLGALPLLNPTTKQQFDKLLLTLGPILASHSKKPHYLQFIQELIKELCRDLPSEQVKKASSTLTTLGNDKLREEKAAEKGGKKSKAAKTKTTLAVGRPNIVDTRTYDDDAYGDDDFM